MGNSFSFSEPLCSDGKDSEAVEAVVPCVVSETAAFKANIPMGH